MKFYKRLLKFIPILVMLVVLPRVANFVRQLAPQQAGVDLHDIISVAFAMTLALGVITTSYFSSTPEAPQYDDEPGTPREKRRREREATFFATMHTAAPYATFAMLLFAFLDGAFNLADALSGARENGIFDVENTALRAVYVVAAILFGLAPTILAVVLVRVVSVVDRIPEDYTRPVTKREIDWIRTVLGNMGMHEFRASDAAELLAGNGERNEPTERIPRNVPRNREHGTEEQRQKVIDYIRSVQMTENRTPGPSEIARETGVSKTHSYRVLNETREN